MQVIPNDKILPVDIDETLITYGKHGVKGGFYVQYGGEAVFVRPKKMNIALMKHHKTQRDYFILVWSANGKEWAQKIITLLNLEPYVDLIMTKPHKYLDDKPANEWMCDRIDLKDDVL